MRAKDKLGVNKTESQERLQSWVENLSKILNRDDPKNPVEEKEETEELEYIEEIDVGRWRIQEVKDAFRKAKPGPRPTKG